MKGIDIVVHGNIGHMSAFMAQAGNLVVCGDAGEALGDSSTRRGCSCAAR
jgi:glutamate synthase domain-containing protein 3